MGSARMSNTPSGILFNSSDDTASINLPYVPARRVAYVDSSRGILILLMLAVHAASPCVDSIRGSIQGFWVFDIATKGFVMLAGFTFGIVYTEAYPPKFGKALRRCFELLVVMFCSNMLLTIARLALTDELGNAITWSWFLGLFTFQTEYNISGVLLPIALLLPLLFVVYDMERRWGMVTTLCVVILMLTACFTWAFAGPHNKMFAGVIDVGFAKGVGGFPLVPYMSYGILGFLTARIFGSANIQIAWPALATTIFIGLLLYAATIPHIVPLRLSSTDSLVIVSKYMKAEGMFLMILGVGMAVSLLFPYASQQNPINLLGYYGLFAFVIHRLIGHSTILIFHLHDGGYLVFIFQFTIILVLTYLACLLRTQVMSVDRFLSKLFL